MNNKLAAQIVILSILSCIGLYIIEQILQVPYIYKTGAKLLLFLVIPLFYIKLVLKQPVLAFLNLKSFDFKNLRLGFYFGLLSMGIVVGTFFLLEDFIQTDKILEDLRGRLEITAEQFIFIAFYITFGNSLLEEFYFRGFIFLNLYKSKYKKFAYIFSALLFSVYHVAIFAVWFEFWLILLAMFGLFVVGLIFNWLNTKSNNFLNSWILHILADVGVMIVGFYLFEFI